MLLKICHRYASKEENIDLCTLTLNTILHFYIPLDSGLSVDSVSHCVVYNSI